MKWWLITKKILGEYKDNIEEYGWNNGKYEKLSDKIIDAIQEGVKQELIATCGRDNEYVNQIVRSRYLYYSKKLHGDKMLREIDPVVVAEKCRKYFRIVYNQICEKDDKKNIVP